MPPSIEKQKSDLYEEVEQIVKSGSTVQKVETKKLIMQHQKVLEEFKQCAGISDENWDEYLSQFNYFKLKNERFYMKLFFFKPYTESNSPYTKVICRAINKLQQRNLNPNVVNIVYNKDLKNMGQALQEFQEQEISNTIELICANIPEQIMDFVIDHEITHLQQNHHLQSTILRHITQKKECLTPVHHQQEYEADLLFALHDINSARNGVMFACSPKYSKRYPDSERIPSHFKRCIQLQRIVAMLELEQEIKEALNREQRCLTEDPIFLCTEW